MKYNNLHYFTLFFLIVLVGCQKDEIESDPAPYYPPVVTEFAYFSGILKDETSLEPIAGVGISYSSGSATYCGQTSDTTDENGRFLLRTCYQLNGQPSYIPYPQTILIIAYDTQSNSTTTYQNLRYVNTDSIQTGDTLFFDVYTTLDF